MIAMKSARQRALTLSSLVLHREHCRVRVLTQIAYGAPNEPTRMNARKAAFPYRECASGFVSGEQCLSKRTRIVGQRSSSLHHWNGMSLVLQCMAIVVAHSSPRKR